MNAIVKLVKVSVEEVENSLDSILDKVEKGEAFIITRRGKPIAQISQSGVKSPALKSLKPFRDKIHIKNEPLSQTVINQRDEERY